MLFWPAPLLYAETVDWGLTGAVITGGTTLGGASQVGFASGGPFWRLKLDGLVIADRTALLAARAIQAAMDGGATPIVVGPCDCWFAPFSVGASGSSVPHSDEMPFSDGGLYYSSSISATVGAAASLRAASLTLAITGGSAVGGGEHFSIDHPTAGRRMYRIIAVTGGTDEAPIVSIRPLLREAVAASEVVDFDKPSCLMRLSDPEGFPLPIQHGIFAETSASFVEWAGDAP